MLTTVSSPSLPRMFVTPATIQSFTFLISPPEVSGQCVTSYIITSTSSDGTVSNFTVEVTDRGEPVSILQSGFNLCSNTYSFTVSAVTAAVVENSSEVIHPMSS